MIVWTMARRWCFILAVWAVSPLTASPGVQALEPLRFGRASVEDPSTMLARYQPLLAALGERLGRPVVLVQAASYPDLTRLFREGKVHLGIINAYSFIQMDGDPRFLPIAKRVIDRKSSYCAYVIVRKEAAASSLTDLKGKTFAFSEANSTTGSLLPRLLLQRKGLDPARDFAKTTTITQHDSILLAVANRSVDAAAVASYVFDAYDRRVTEKMRILDRSESIPYGPIIVRKDLGKVTIRSIQDFFLGLDRSAGGRALLTEAGFTGFVSAHSRDYDIIRHLSGQLLSPDANP